MSGGIDSSVIKILNNVTSGNPTPEFVNNGNFTDIEEVVITNMKPLSGKKADLILPGKIEMPEMPKIGDNIRLNNYSQTYTTGEDKVHLYKFGDPLTLNFKVIIDYNKKTGLFADESFDDSALTFLKRIGETHRYEMLKHWIKVFQSLVKDFDYLFLDIDGLEVVQTKPNHEFFFDSDKIKLTFRETTDMLIQSLITTYKNIVYDSIRKVTVLPSNLRKFDCYVVVFSAGYYNILFHDFNETNKNDMDARVLPTKKKLADEILDLSTVNDFNHTLYEFVSCSIDNESGSMYLDNISNEMTGEYVKNNISFTYKFASVSGTYNNIMGDENWFSILAQAAAENKLNNVARMQYVNNVGTGINPGSEFKADGKDFFSKENLQNILGNTVIDKKLLNDVKSFASKDTLKGIFNSVKTSTLTKLEDKLVNQLPTKLLGPHTVLGQTLQKLNPEHVTNMIQNTVDLGIGKVQDLFDDGVTNVNNLLFNNYSDNLVDVYNNVFAGYKPNNKIEVIEQNPSVPYFDENPNNEYTGLNYVKPINPTLDETLDDNKFVKGRNGIGFFNTKSDQLIKNSNNISIRKGF